MTEQGGTFGRYEVRGELGVGGFATVYRAWDSGLQREVALKVLHPWLAHDASVRQRFLAEARALARLHHPHIVTVHDVGETDGRPFVAMELLGGYTLGQLLEVNRLPELNRILALLRPLASAIDAVHAAGIVHRDIKPANVMLALGERVVLMDFGVAHTSEAAMQTHTGAVLGTPAYMSPEQVLGNPVGPAADIYALGVLAYHLVAGKEPFSGDTARLLYAHGHETPPDLQLLRPGLQPQVYAAIECALAKNPASRPGSAGEFVRILAGSQSWKPLQQASGTETNAARSPRSRLPLIGAVGMLLAVLGIAAKVAVSHGKHRTPLPFIPSSTAAASEILPVNPIPHDSTPTLRQAATSPATAFSTAIASQTVLTTAPSPTPAPSLPIVQPADPSALPTASRSPSPAPSALTIVSTYAGSGATGSSDSGGFADGSATTARFAYPQGVAVDRSGNVYLPDLQNHRIRKISPDGTVSTLAGSGVAGLTDGKGVTAQFNYPAGIAVDSAGTLYVSDFYNHRIRKVTPAGIVTTLAGTGPSGRNAGSYADGPAGMARFNLPAGLAVDAQGNVYVADLMNNRVRRIAPDGSVTTIAGNGRAGYADGPAAQAQFNDTAGVAVGTDGTVYVADFNNNRVRRISAEGIVDTYAGSGIAGLTDGAASGARFNGPTRLAIDDMGNLYVADLNNQAIRRIATDGTVSTIAGGNGAGYADGPVATARFNQPEGVAVDAAGNVYVADGDNNRVRRISR